MIYVGFILAIFASGTGGYYAFPYVEGLVPIFGVAITSAAIAPAVFGALISRLFDRLDSSVESSSKLVYQESIRVAKHIKDWHVKLINLWLYILVLCIITASASAAFIGDNNRVLTVDKRLSFAVAIGSIVGLLVFMLRIRYLFVKALEFRIDLIERIESESNRSVELTLLKHSTPPTFSDDDDYRLTGKARAQS